MQSMPMGTISPPLLLIQQPLLPQLGRNALDHMESVKWNTILGTISTPVNCFSSSALESAKTGIPINGSVKRNRGNRIKVVVELVRNRNSLFWKLNWASLILVHDQITIPITTILNRALLRIMVNMYQAKTLGESGCPLEVIH